MHKTTWDWARELVGGHFGGKQIIEMEKRLARLEAVLRFFSSEQVHRCVLHYEAVFVRGLGKLPGAK